jgi:hypothetical protein
MALVETALGEPGAARVPIACRAGLWASFGHTIQPVVGELRAATARDRAAVNLLGVDLNQAERLQWSKKSAEPFFN